MIDTGSENKKGKMALHVPRAPGFSSMLKEGAKHYSGLDEAVCRNIEACKELAKTTRSAYGPNGQNKMVINHLEKLFVTNDAATILRELEVEHPAAKMLVLATQQQEQECGDGTNFVMVFAGALLEQAEEMLRMGLSVPNITDGYDLALLKAQEILKELVCYEVKDVLDKASLSKAIRTAVMSKQYGNEDFLANLIAEACASVLPKTGTLNVDNIRVCKILGSGIHNSTVLQGMVFKRQVEGNRTKAERAKVAVFTCPFDIMQTETKGTVLIKSAKELMDYSKGEEEQIEAQVKAIAETGCQVLVTGGKAGELAMHYANKYNLMVIRMPSKWDVRRLCKTIGATALPRLCVPTAEECGFCDFVYVDEVGDTPCVVFRQEKVESQVATIVIRGSTENIMDDIERAIDDGVNTVKGLTKDGKMVPGGGATEIELAKRIATYSETHSGLEQYAIKEFATALESFPKALAENAGVKSTEVISQLYAAHQKGKLLSGFSAENSKVEDDVVELGLLDGFLNRYWGLKFATNAACTVLKVDQIIMAKKAGGPKPKQNKDWDED